MWVSPGHTLAWWARGGRGGGSLLIPEHHLGKAVSKAHFQFTSESLAGGGAGVQRKTQRGGKGVFKGPACKAWPDL